MFWDVHSHVVPSGDDGVASVDEGLELCREAARRGTTVLFATPHVWPHLELSAEREEAIRSAHAAMVPRAAEAGLDLRLGFELTPGPALLEEDLGRYRLGETSAVLMELPFAGPLGLAERVAEEIEAAGLAPVVAHPERARAVTDDPGRATAYHERGWLLQVNATSLLGYHGDGPARTAWQLVEEGLVALVGSDGHRARRPPFLDEAYGAVRGRVGEAAEALFDGSALQALVVPRV
ncbi:MAG: protein-tyrosine-phosphatase [Actinomycetota bacterium]|nr:protein-tyrosine-phosphatase [Actinomycetota bacterium]